jgi:uncharacterized protein YodC (DUF2158 family)
VTSSTNKKEFSLNENQWKPGDIVGVKSGGPPMTVARAELGKVFCEWFDGKNPMSGEFTPAVLEKRLNQGDAMKAAAETMKRNLRPPRRTT